MGPLSNCFLLKCDSNYMFFYTGYKCSYLIPQNLSMDSENVTNVLNVNGRAVIIISRQNKTQDAMEYCSLDMNIVNNQSNSLHHHKKHTGYIYGRWIRLVSLLVHPSTVRVIRLSELASGAIWRSSDLKYKYTISFSMAPILRNVFVTIKLNKITI